MNQKVTSPEDVARLNSEIERLQRALAVETEKVTKAEAETKRLADAQGYLSLQREVNEIPTGKTVKVKRATKYEHNGYSDDGRERVKPVFTEVELPTYKYRVELPPSGGQGISINGQWFYHDEVYEFDIDLLRTVKDMVHRSWAHEGTIKGNDENVFRKPQDRVLRGGRRAA